VLLLLLILVFLIIDDEEFSLFSIFEFSSFNVVYLLMASCRDSFSLKLISELIFCEFNGLLLVTICKIIRLYI